MSLVEGLFFTKSSSSSATSRKYRARGKRISEVDTSGTNATKRACGRPSIASNPQSRKIRSLRWPIRDWPILSICCRSMRSFHPRKLCRRRGAQRLKPSSSIPIWPKPTLRWQMCFCISTATGRPPIASIAAPSSAILTTLWAITGTPICLPPEDSTRRPTSPSCTLWRLTRFRSLPGLGWGYVAPGAPV